MVTDGPVPHLLLLPPVPPPILPNHLTMREKMKNRKRKARQARQMMQNNRVPDRGGRVRGIDD